MLDEMTQQKASKRGKATFVICLHAYRQPFANTFSLIAN